MYKGTKSALAPARFIPLKGLGPAAIFSSVFQLTDEVSYLQLKQ